MPGPSTLQLASRRYALAALACWAAFAVVWWLVRTGASQRFDSGGVLLWRTAPGLMPAGPAWLTGVVRAITEFGSVLPRNGLALVAVGVLLWLNRTRAAVLFATSVMTAWILDWLLKAAVDRPRPQLVPHLAGFTGTSFPSGHSFNAAAIYIMMAMVFAVQSPRRGARLAMVGGGILLSLIVALSRVWLGVHWPSDVIAGWLGGTGCALLALAVLSRKPE